MCDSCSRETKHEDDAETRSDEFTSDLIRQGCTVLARDAAKAPDRFRCVQAEDSIGGERVAFVSLISLE